MYLLSFKAKQEVQDIGNDISVYIIKLCRAKSMSSWLSEENTTKICVILAVTYMGSTLINI